MFIVLLLFFKSICLYCQRLVLHVHDRWINPKNVRILKEAAEANGSKFHIDEYREVKKKRRFASGSTAAASSATSALNTLAGSNNNCTFCANTPQGYCRHHFHLRELQVQKQQQKFWCPLSGGLDNSTKYKELRKIKRQLKQSIQLHQQQQQQQRKTPVGFSQARYSAGHAQPSESQSLNSFNDSGYQTISIDSSENSNSNSSNLGSSQSESPTDNQSSQHDEYVDIGLPLASPTSLDSVAETTYSFETCCESQAISPPSSPPPKSASHGSFASCEYSPITTTYL